LKWREYVEESTTFGRNTLLSWSSTFLFDVSDNATESESDGFACGNLVLYGIALLEGGGTPGTTSVTGCARLRRRGWKGAVGFNKA